MKIDDIMNEDIEEVASESVTERVRLSKEELAESARRTRRRSEKDFAADDEDDDEDDEYGEAEEYDEADEYDDEAAEAYEYDIDDEDDAGDGTDEDGDEVSEEEIEGDAKAGSSKAWSWVKELLFFIGCFAVIYAIFYVFPPYLVSGSSMNKTLTDKAFGFGFRYTTPERGDIVILNTGDKQNGTDNRNFIKRVIGVPGDTIGCVWETYDHEVTLTDGTVIPAGEKVYRVYINGVLEEAQYTYYHYQGGSYAPTGEWTLGENEFFVMGDNRFNSHDSRVIGPVTKDEIVCKMLFFLWGKHD